MILRRSRIWLVRPRPERIVLRATILVPQWSGLVIRKRRPVGPTR
jgi:hypothetical protein